MTVNFDRVRPIFGGKLNQGQVDGVLTVSEAFDRYGDGDRRKLAYLLATTKHETAHTMQPIHERGAKAYFDKYEPGTKIGKALGNTLKGDGYKFRGRGYAQLTGRANYAKASRKVGVDLVADPDAALRPDIAARILIVGCLEGWFTGKALADYINVTKTDYRNARRVVNGLDKADAIAAYAVRFEDAVSPAKQTPAPAPAPAPTVTKPADFEPPYTPPKPKTLLDWLKGLFVKQTVAGLVSSKGTDMTTWDQLQQIIRIALYVGLSVWLGQSFADGETGQQTISAVLLVLNFVWTQVWANSKKGAWP